MKVKRQARKRWRVQVDVHTGDTPVHFEGYIYGATLGQAMEDMDKIEDTVGIPAEGEFNKYHARKLTITVEEA